MINDKKLYDLHYEEWKASMRTKKKDAALKKLIDDFKLLGIKDITISGIGVNKETEVTFRIFKSSIHGIHYVLINRGYITINDVDNDNDLKYENYSNVGYGNNLYGSNLRAAYTVNIEIIDIPERDQIIPNWGNGRL